MIATDFAIAPGFFGEPFSILGAFISTISGVSAVSTVSRTDRGEFGRVARGFARGCTLTQDQRSKIKETSDE
ncbi:MAG: hypothetical protein F2634_02070 [Actinobacteria bacterium]|nr:hypothetical protein [Actinomycetota bacterium]